MRVFSFLIALLLTVNFYAAVCFAEDDSHPTNYRPISFTEGISQENSLIGKQGHTKAETLKLLNKSYVSSNGGLIKYGPELFSYVGDTDSLSIVKLRAGVSQLSKNAIAGVQLDVNW